LHEKSGGSFFALHRKTLLQIYHVLLFELFLSLIQPYLLVFRLNETTNHHTCPQHSHRSYTYKISIPMTLMHPILTLLACLPGSPAEGVPVWLEKLNGPAYLIEGPNEVNMWPYINYYAHEIAFPELLPWQWARLATSATNSDGRVDAGTWFTGTHNSFLLNPCGSLPRLFRCRRLMPFIPTISCTNPTA